MAKRQLIERFSNPVAYYTSNRKESHLELYEPVKKTPKITTRGFPFHELMTMPEIMNSVINKMDCKDYANLRQSNARINAFCHKNRKCLGVSHPGVMTISPKITPNGSVTVNAFLNILGFSLKDALQSTSGISFRYFEFIDPLNFLSAASDEVKADLLELIKGRKWRTVGLSMLNPIPNLISLIAPQELCNVSTSNKPYGLLKSEAFPSLKSFGIFSQDWRIISGRFRHSIQMWVNKLTPTRMHLSSGVIVEERLGNALAFPDQNWLHLQIEQMLPVFMDLCYTEQHEWNYPQTEILNNGKINARIRTKITRDDKATAWVVVYIKPYNYKYEIRYQAYAHFYADMPFVLDPPVYLPLPL